MAPSASACPRRELVGVLGSQACESVVRPMAGRMSLRAFPAPASTASSTSVAAGTLNRQHHSHPVQSQLLRRRCLRRSTLSRHPGAPRRLSKVEHQHQSLRLHRWRQRRLAVCWAKSPGFSTAFSSSTTALACLLRPHTGQLKDGFATRRLGCRLAAWWERTMTRRDRAHRPVAAATESDCDERQRLADFCRRAELAGVARSSLGRRRSLGMTAPISSAESQTVIAGGEISRRLI